MNSKQDWIRLVARSDDRDTEMYRRQETWGVQRAGQPRSVSGQGVWLESPISMILGFL